LNAAVELAKTADVVFFVGGLNKNYFQDCEGGDRKSLSLPFGEDKLIESIQKVNKNVVVVLLSGNAVDMPWLSKIPAVVQAWYLGSEAGNAIVDIISGDVNPSGKLPFTFPKKLTDIGAHAFDKLCYPGDSVNVYYKEDILVGYRWLDTKKIEPLFPFGCGLSYTTFAYSKPSVDATELKSNGTVKISFTMTNTGKVDGHETAQLYVSKSKSIIARAAKELKAFKKTFLKAGESKIITIEVPVSSLAYFNEAKQAWEVESGIYSLLLGSSSRDIKGKVDVKINSLYISNN